VSCCTKDLLVVSEGGEREREERKGKRGEGERWRERKRPVGMSSSGGVSEN
jgi:hypothetical protein